MFTCTVSKFAYLSNFTYVSKCVHVNGALVIIEVLLFCNVRKIYRESNTSDMKISKSIFGLGLGWAAANSMYPNLAARYYPFCRYFILTSGGQANYSLICSTVY